MAKSAKPAAKKPNKPDASSADNKGGLSIKQKTFCDEYLVDLNGTQAAIRAGYSAKTANEQASRLLTNVNIQALIAERTKEREKRTEITQDMVLAELAKIGFSDIRKAVKWGSELSFPQEDDAEPVTVLNSIALVDSDKLDESTAAAISEIAQTQQGMKIKLHDKRAALVDIGRHLGMFKDKVELTGKDGDPLIPESSALMRSLSGKELEELTALLGKIGVK